MPSHISANQHRAVRNNQRMEENQGQYREREVVIYDNADCIRRSQEIFRSQEAGPQTQNHPPVHRKSLRGAALCLGLLCLLMTAAIIFLSINYSSLKIDNQQLGIFNEQLQTRLNNLSISYNQSQEANQLQDQITANNSRLQDEIKKLKIKTKECPGGWKRFGWSCYFKSTEKRKWSESRSFCQERGSDLVIINSKEEQEFVTELIKNEESWIGLRTIENQTASTGFQWEWVDDSPLTETFWATAELENPTNWFAAVCCDQQGKWTRSGYNTNPDTRDRKWICEK